MCRAILQWMKRCGFRITFSGIIALTLCAEGLGDEVRVLEVISVRSAVTATDEVGRHLVDSGTSINVGNQVEVPRFGGLAVKVVDGSLLKLGGATAFHYRHSPEKIIEGTLSRGSLWYRSNEQRAEFLITTPGTEISIRGTEWVVRVSDEGVTTLAVLEGAGLVAESRAQRQAGEGEVVLTGEVARVAGAGESFEMLAESPLQSANWVRRYRPLWVSDELNKTPPPEVPEMLRALEAFRTGDLPTLEAILVDSKVRLAETREWLVLRGFLDLAVGDRRAAEKRFERAISVDANWPVPHANLALVALVNRELDEAESHSRTALDLDPDDLTALLVRTRVARALLNFDLAEETAKHALYRAPQFWRAQVAAAEIFLDIKRPKRAQTLMRQGSLEVADHPEVLTVNGYIALESMSNEEAHTYFSEALASAPENVDALTGLGIALDRLGRGDDGVASLQLASLLEPWNVVPRAFLARTYFAMGKDGSAFVTIEKAKAADASDPLPWFIDGELLAEDGRFGKALTSLEKARVLTNARPLSGSSRLLEKVKALLAPTIATVYLKSGLRASAFRHAADALERDPLNVAAYKVIELAAESDPRGYSRLSNAAFTFDELLAPPSKREAKMMRLSRGPSPIDGSLSVDYGSGRFTQSDIDYQYRSREPTVALSADSGGRSHYYASFAPERNVTRLVTEVPEEYPDQEESNVSFLSGRWQPTLNSVISAYRVSVGGESEWLGCDWCLRPYEKSRLTTSGITASVIDRDSWTGLYKVEHGNWLSRDVSFYSLLFDETLVWTSPSKVLEAAWLKRFDQHNVRVGIYYREETDRFNYTYQDILWGYVFPGDAYEVESTHGSAYLVDQFSLNSSTNITAGLVADVSRYSPDWQKEVEVKRLNPLFGMTRNLDAGWTVRGALYRQFYGTSDIVGRLQPLTIAGFPWLGAEAFFNVVESQEQRSNMRQSTFRLGLDHQSSDHRTFWGAEAALIDLAYSRVRNDGQIGNDAPELERRGTDLIDFQTYLESRFDDGWSAAAEVHHLVSKKRPDSTTVWRRTGTKFVLKVRRFFESNVVLAMDSSLERLRFASGETACGRALGLSPWVSWTINRKTTVRLDAWFTKRLGSDNTCFDGFTTFNSNSAFDAKQLLFTFNRTF